MRLHLYEYFHSKIAAQSCLNRADRLVHGDTNVDDPRLRVDAPLLAELSRRVIGSVRPRLCENVSFWTVERLATKLVAVVRESKGDSRFALRKERAHLLGRIRGKIWMFFP